MTTKMMRTYVDASVLIDAYRGQGRAANRALEVLDDPNRILVVSDFLRLEVLPKPTFCKNSKELEFMENILQIATVDVPATPQLTDKAITFASNYDTAPMDALHIAAAVVGEAEEFVTLEKPSSPMSRVNEIKVVSLRSDGGA